MRNFKVDVAYNIIRLHRYFRAYGKQMTGRGNSLYGFIIKDVKENTHQTDEIHLVNIEKGAKELLDYKNTIVIYDIV